MMAASSLLIPWPTCTTAAARVKLAEAQASATEVDLERLTVRAPDQQLTHMACDESCKICKRRHATHLEDGATN